MREIVTLSGAAQLACELLLLVWNGITHRKYTSFFKTSFSSLFILLTVKLIQQHHHSPAFSFKMLYFEPKTADELCGLTHPSSTAFTTSPA